MKIISKYKDFYDYMSVDYDADVIYVRKPELVCDEGVCRQVTQLISPMLRKGIPTMKYFSNTRFLHFDGTDGILIVNIVFGIYPNVYSVPVIKVNDNVFLMSRQLVSDIINSDDSEKIVNRFLMGDMKCLPIHDKAFHFIDKTLTKRLKGFAPYLFRQGECPEAFKLLKAPVFLKVKGGYEWDTSFILGKTDFFDPITDEKARKAQYITNIVFDRLVCNVLSPFTEDIYNLNTPINIENFLVSMKQEPISDPDNKTKIEMHGFDIKRSFRNMKR